MKARVAIVRYVSAEPHPGVVEAQFVDAHGRGGREGQVEILLSEPDRGKEREPAIRVAENRDAPAIAQIYVDSWNLAFDGLMPRLRLDTERVARWRREIAAPFPHQWWVAELVGVVVGFAGIGPSRDPIDPELGELDTIAVDSRLWRQGIGRALMAQALCYLMADGYREAMLWTLAGYEPGKGFYEATGWRLDGAVRNDGRQVRYCYRLLP